MVDLGQVVRRLDRLGVLDADPLASAVSKNPPAPGVDASRKVSGETHSALPVVRMTWSSVTPFAPSSRRVDLHLELLLALTPDRDVGDARDAHQRGPDRPAGEHAEVDERLGPPTTARSSSPGSSTTAAGASAAACETFGRACAWVSRSFTTWRARPAIGAGLEDHLDPRQPGHRLGADDVEERDAVEQVLLERDGDELLDLLGGEPERLGLHLHRRPARTRAATSRGMPAELHDAEDQHADAERDDQALRLQAAGRRSNASSDATSRSGGSKRGLSQRVVGSRCRHDPNGGVSQVRNPADAWAHMGAESRQRIPPKGPNGVAEASPFHALWSIGCRQWQRSRGPAIAPGLGPGECAETGGRSCPLEGRPHRRVDPRDSAVADRFAPSPPARTHPRRDRIRKVRPAAVVVNRNVTSVVGSDIRRKMSDDVLSLMRLKQALPIP